MVNSLSPSIDLVVEGGPSSRRGSSKATRVTATPGGRPQPRAIDQTRGIRKRRAGTGAETGGMLSRSRMAPWANMRAVAEKRKKDRHVLGSGRLSLPLARGVSHTDALEAVAAGQGQPMETGHGGEVITVRSRCLRRRQRGRISSWLPRSSDTRARTGTRVLLCCLSRPCLRRGHFRVAERVSVGQCLLPGPRKRASRSFRQPHKLWPHWPPLATTAAGHEEQHATLGESSVLLLWPAPDCSPFCRHAPGALQYRCVRLPLARVCTVQRSPQRLSLLTSPLQYDVCRHLPWPFQRPGQSPCARK